MRKILLLIIFSICSFPLKAMERFAVRNDGLIAMERLKKLPVAEKPVRQIVHTFPIDHSFFRDRDIPNYNNLIAFIRELDAEAKRSNDSFVPLVVYVEHSPGLLGRRFINEGVIHPSIDGGLVRYSEENPFELSQVINCETRTISRGASWILACADIPRLDELIANTKKLDSHFKEPFKTFGCDIEQITFENLQGEFDQQYAELQSYKNIWSDETEVVAVFESALTSISQRLAVYKAKIDELKCAKRKIIEYARFLLETKDDELRKFLNLKDSHVSSPLLDLYLLHSILSLRNKAVRKIAIVAGPYHTGSITGDLARIYGGFRALGAVVSRTSPEDMKKKFEEIRTSTQEDQTPY